MIGRGRGGSGEDNGYFFNYFSSVTEPVCNAFTRLVGDKGEEQKKKGREREKTSKVKSVIEIGRVLCIKYIKLCIKSFK